MIASSLQSFDVAAFRCALVVGAVIHGHRDPVQRNGPDPARHTYADAWPRAVRIWLPTSLRTPIARTGF